MGTRYKKKSKQKAMKMRTVIADSHLQMFSPAESNPYPALACIPASAGAAVEALRSNSTRKSCISRPAGS